MPKPRLTVAEPDLYPPDFVVRPVGARSALDDLGRLLHAFGLVEARDGAPEGKRRPHDETARSSPERLQAEIVASRALVLETIASIERTRARVMPPIEYAREWRRIVEKWNTTILHAGWTQVPALCEVCGRPVVGKRLVHATGRQSTTCSTKCAGTTRKRRQRG